MPEEPDQKEVTELVPRGEVLPAVPSGIRISFWNRPTGRIVATGLCLLPIASVLAQNFFQLRGYVNILASRIVLYLAAACVSGWLWIWARNTQKPRILWPIIATLVIFAAAFGLDWKTSPIIPEEQLSDRCTPSVISKFGGDQGDVGIVCDRWFKLIWARDSAPDRDDEEIYWSHQTEQVLSGLPDFSCENDFVHAGKNLKNTQPNSNDRLKVMTAEIGAVSSCVDRMEGRK